MIWKSQFGREGYLSDKIYGRVDLLEKTIMYTHRREDDKNIAFETINTFRDAYAAASRFLQIRL